MELLSSSSPIVIFIKYRCGCVFLCSLEIIIHNVQECPHVSVILDSDLRVNKLRGP
jgi:hypothetical protein